MNELTKQFINNAVKYARTKHPEFAKDMGKALLLAQEELGEAIKAYNDKKEDEVLMELAHSAAVIVRILNGEINYLLPQNPVKEQVVEHNADNCVQVREVLSVVQNPATES